MGDMLKELRERSKKRKKLLAQTVSYFCIYLFRNCIVTSITLLFLFISLGYLELMNYGKY